MFNKKTKLYVVPIKFYTDFFPTTSTSVVLNDF